ncbi:MAG TPA: hypothetical protein VF668_01430 [Pyrinomonadaceae bacterium]|jgi:hypothetical protein
MSLESEDYLFRISYDGDRLAWRHGREEAEALRAFTADYPAADVHRVRPEWLRGAELLEEMERHGQTSPAEVAR